MADKCPCMPNLHKAQFAAHCQCCSMRTRAHARQNAPGGMHVPNQKLGSACVSRHGATSPSRSHPPELSSDSHRSSKLMRAVNVFVVVLIACTAAASVIHARSGGMRSNAVRQLVPEPGTAGEEDNADWLTAEEEYDADWLREKTKALLRARALRLWEERARRKGLL